MSLATKFATLTALLVVDSLCANSAFACSLVDAKVSMTNAVRLSSYYWLASGALGGAIVCIDLYQKR